MSVFTSVGNGSIGGLMHDLFGEYQGDRKAQNLLFEMRPSFRL
jgi:hypothetical protein